jgi:predicted lactoylglutathione lyase
MAQKTASTLKSEDVKGKLILQFGKENNFTAWKLSQIDRCSIEFGYQANVLKNNVAYVPPAIAAADYTPPAIEGEAALSSAALTQLRVDAEKQRNKEVLRLKQTMPKFFATLWESLSVESREEVSQHERFIQADLDQDPNVLWIIIRETHLTAIHGIGLGALEIVNLKNKFGQLRQRTGASIGEFKKEFDLQYEVLRGAGVADTTQPELAMLFLSKLDPQRYAGMLAHLTNDATLGRAFPLTLHSAWSIASGWKTATTKIAGGSDMHSVFVLADEMTSTPRYVAAGRGSNQAGRGAVSKQGGRGATAGRSHLSKKGTAETRTCRGCLVKGHLWADCPDNPNRTTANVMVATGEEDDDDMFGSAFMIKDDESKDSMVLFSNTEVLLDNQAGRSIFRNKSLLSNVNAVKPFYIGGIDGESRGLRIGEEGDFEGLGRVGYQPQAAANILSKARVLDAGNTVSYDQQADVYTLEGQHRNYTFSRKLLDSGRRSSHYACELVDESLFVTTVEDNMRKYTKREVIQAKNARELMARLGHASSQVTIDLLDAGLSNCDVSKQDVRNADAIFGLSISSLKGKTHKQASTPAASVIAPRVTQVQQILAVDIFFVKKLPFLLGVLTPLGLAVCIHIKNRTTSCIAAGIRSFLNTAASRNFDCVQLRTDGEGAIAAMTGELSGMGIVVETAGPGQHVPVVERRIQTVKERVRAYENSLPFVMTRLLLVMCVLFCVSRINMQPSRTTQDRTSPLEQFTGRKLDAARDLRVQFGDYVQATVSDPDNSMRPRTQGCIALLPTGNLTGSVKFWCLSTNHTVTRDQFRVLPMPDLVVSHITSLAASEGYTRGFDPDVGPLEMDLRDPQVAAPLPDMMNIDGRAGIMQLADHYAIAPDAGVNDDIGGAPDNQGEDIEGLNEVAIVNSGEVAVASEEVLEAPVEASHLHLPRHYLPAQRHGRGVDSLQGLQGSPRTLILHSATDAVVAKIRNELVRKSAWRDDHFAFTMSVRAALRERGEEATPVIMAELQQMLDKKVWHGVLAANLTKNQRRAIIRSSMFLKDKYLASGAFERFKARLVAGGNQQDKGLYENLSSPTVSTTSVLTLAAIAAAEGRTVIAIDIGGAFLNADMEPTGVEVHMRLDSIMTRMLVQLDPSYKKFVERDGTAVVKLDKALYGCVEASALWYNDIRSKLLADGFVENPYDPCVFNKLGARGSQISIAIHVDDLMVSSVSQEDLEVFQLYLKSVYPEIRCNGGAILDYVGMTFDFSEPGQVRVTMDNCVDDILSGCGVETTRATPAASVLFDVRDAPKSTESESKWFHTYVAKVLYLAKRARPECLTAVAFLSTRVAVCDIDDLAKLRRLLGYIKLTRDRGIVLRVGDTMEVKAFIDAAYGVHQDSGKSHTGCAIVLGAAGPIFAKSAKQKIVTKSSTEAELVGLSDTASQAIHLRNFILAQGYKSGPVQIFQDNMSCMALIKRGGPGSERSRHINIRHFWLSEKVAQEEVVLQHLRTEDMFANILTKPVQGAQFERERQGLTNWEA